jgi:hypothetical protein
MTNNNTLFIFDLDDTLIHTTARVILSDNNGNKKYLTAKQYGELTDISNMNIDFTEFDNPDILLNDSKKLLFDVWKSMCKAGCNTLLLTAREQTNMIQYWCTYYGIDVRQLPDNEELNGNYVLCVHDKNNKYIDSTLSTPVAKKTVIEKLIINNNIDNIIVFEDSETICQEIETIKKNKNIKVNLIIYQA